MTFAYTPRGSFDLALTNQFFGGWTTPDPHQAGLALSFPLEGWRTSAAVTMRQEQSGAITGEVYGAGDESESAWRQALAVLSLDVDGAQWPEVGRRDPVIGHLQRSYTALRPVLFHSPYEAAAAFIIGQRISIQQGRAIRQSLAEQMGEKQQVEGTLFSAFPGPRALLDLTGFKGMHAEKVQRLHGVAQAALDGLLERAYLRSLPVEQALQELRSIPGVGPFFAQGILMRGAGLVDAVTDDDGTKEAIQRAYGLAQRPDQRTVLRMAETWRPYRMWATVLMHVWLRRSVGGHAESVEDQVKQGSLLPPRAVVDLPGDTPRR
jgi:DNA-3-methyladenine glycosylase II